MSDFAYSKEYHTHRSEGWCQVFKRVSAEGVTPVRAKAADGGADAPVFEVVESDYHTADMCPMNEDRGRSACACCGEDRRVLGRPQVFVCGECLTAGCTATRKGGKFGFLTCKVAYWQGKGGEYPSRDGRWIIRHTGKPGTPGAYTLLERREGAWHPVGESFKWKYEAQGYVEASG